MSRRTGTLSLSSNIEPRMAAPLDAREIVPLKTDLTASGTFPYHYVGMKVVPLDEGKIYILMGDDPTVASNWVPAGGGVEDVELTQAQYDALTPEEKNNGTHYFVIDGEGGGSGGGSSLPSGGTTGQVLAKHSNSDGDVEWVTLSKKITATVDDDTLTFTDSSINADSIIEGPYIQGVGTFQAEGYESVAFTAVTHTLVYTFSDNSFDGSSAVIIVK